MKKILSILSIFILALTLVACGGSKEIDAVKENLEVLFEDPDNVKSGFDLPTEFAHGVTGEWKSSNEEIITFSEPNDLNNVTLSVTRPDHTKEDVRVKVTVDLKKGRKKDSWSIDLKVIKLSAPAYYGNSFSGVTKDVAGKSIEVTGVSFASKLGKNGYYLKTEDGKLAYVHGQASMPDAGKLFDITATVDNYFNALQLKDVNYTVVDGTPTSKVKYDEFTIDQLTNLPEPSPDNVYGAVGYKLKNVQLIVDDSIADANYNLFLVDENHTGKRTGENSIMIYYHSTLFDKLKGLGNSNTYISEIDVVLEGYRTDLNVWYVSYIEEEEDIKLASDDHVEVVEGLKELFLPKLKYDEEPFELLEVANELEVTWSSSDDDVIDPETGAITFKDERVTVTLTASITKGEVTLTKKFDIDVTKVVTIEEAKSIKNNEEFSVEGVVLGVSANNTIIIQDDTGGIALYGKGLSSAGFDIGDLIVVKGTKDVYSGLHQLKDYEVVKQDSDNSIQHDVTDITEMDLEDNALINLQSTIVTLKGMIVKTYKKDSYGSVEMTLLRLDGQEITFKWDNRVPLDENDLIFDLKEGDYIDLIEVPLGWAGGPLLATDNTGQVVINQNTSVELDLEIAVVLLKIKDAQFLEDSTVEFDKISNDIQVTWEFKDKNNDANKFVNLETGEIKIDEGEIHLVTLVATMKKDDKTITQEVTFELIGKNVETFERPEILGESTSYTGNYEFTGVGGTEWDIVGRTDMDSYAIEGGGIMLRQEKDNGYIQVTFKNGLDEFEFEYRKAFTGSNKREYKIDITHDGDTQSIDIPAFGEGSGAQDTIHTFKKQELALEGEVIIKIYVVGESGNQAVFDNFSWEDYSS